MKGHWALTDHIYSLPRRQCPRGVCPARPCPELPALYVQPSLSAPAFCQSSIVYHLSVSICPCLSSVCLPPSIDHLPDHLPTSFPPVCPSIIYSSVRLPIGLSSVLISVSMNHPIFIFTYICLSLYLYVSSSLCLSTICLPHWLYNLLRQERSGRYWAYLAIPRSLADLSAVRVSTVTRAAASVDVRVSPPRPAALHLPVAETRGLGGAAPGWPRSARSLGRSLVARTRGDASSSTNPGCAGRVSFLPKPLFKGHCSFLFSPGSFTRYDNYLKKNVFSAHL